ncbi:hypothetical protein ACNI4G_12935 [Gordonia amicalis]|uniref:hypothetical protein n=1 Tax=Gordonia amicalis TaxID=89053 RepID=UPI0029547802|nr:hypothetical protein [Gordonia amicalis]
MAFTGSGEASAALLLPSSYPHTQSLSNGAVTVNVTNETSKTATCWLSVHDASKENQLTLRAAAVNAIIASGIESAVLDSARADAAEGALRVVWSGVSIAKDASSTGTWVSNRTDTSYAIYQECTTPDPVLGLTINGLAQVYTVTGTGKAPDNPGGGDSGGGDTGGGDGGGGDTGGGDSGGDTGGGDSGNGSLGNLFGSS